MRHKNPDGGIFSRETKYLLRRPNSYGKLYNRNHDEFRHDYKDLYELQKYYKNNKEEWEPVYDSYFLITIEDLLTDFILIDGPFEKELNKLTEQVADYFKNNLDYTLKPMANIWDHNEKPYMFDSINNKENVEVEQNLTQSAEGKEETV